jgi:hypothetical protein
MASELMEDMKKHKIAVGLVAMVGLFVLYLLMRSGSSSSSAQSSPLNTIAAADAQEAQIEAASQAAADQNNAQVQTANLQANAVNNQTIGQVEASYNQTDASLIAALAQNQTTQQANSETAGINNNEINASLAATENTNQTNLEGLESTNNYADNLAQLQASLYSQGLTDSTQLATTQLNNQFNLNNQVVGLVGQAGLNHGTTSLEENLTAILAEATGNTNIGVAAENSVGAAQVSSNYATASTLNTLINGISGLGKTTVSTLFG